MMEKLALARSLPQSISLFPVSIIPPMVHSHLPPTLYNRSNDSIVKQHTFVSIFPLSRSRASYPKHIKYLTLLALTMICHIMAFIVSGRWPPPSIPNGTEVSETEPIFVLNESWEAHSVKSGSNSCSQLLTQFPRRCLPTALPEDLEIPFPKCSVLFKIKEVW